MMDYKILILAYLIGHSPVETQTTFQMEGWFNSMEECKEELLKKKDDGRYEVMNEFVIDGDFKWDWLIAGCKSDTTGEEFQVYPDYPNGKPEELEGIEFKLEEIKV
tara:strand:- start:258 stop:575 length:318 start_codon:yes stop_codon:yes gene_type:complete